MFVVGSTFNCVRLSHMMMGKLTILCAVGGYATEYWNSSPDSSYLSFCMQNIAGTFSPGIEIWDLDVLDSVEPLTTLGGPVAEGEAAQPTKEEMSAKGKKKKKKKAAKVSAGGNYHDSAHLLAGHCWQDIAADHRYRGSTAAWSHF
jgi:hypothetical protein